MTDQQMNGTPPAQPPLDQVLDQTLFPTVNFMTRGACSSIAGVPPDRVLVALCRNLGRVIGMSFGAGDLGPLLRARAECKKAFTEGIDSIKPQPKMPPPQAETKIPGA